MTVRMLIICGGSGVNLLNQRQALGMDAAIYIDVSKAQDIQSSWRQDLRCFVVEPDRNTPTAALLFQEAVGRIAEQVFPEDAGVSEYVQRGIYREQDARHTRFLADYTVANIDLGQGLAQSPAIGGLSIRHPANRASMEQMFNLALSPMGLGPANPLEAWIVSSTAGGTGAGMHRFIAAYLADLLHRWYRDTPLQVNFVQIGQLTYRTVNAQQTALSTFFSVAADAALALKTGEQFPWMVTHWFYMDVPDVGSGERSTSTRARIVEIAVKTVMLEELRSDLQRLVFNNRGIPMVLTRTGYWERDFGERRKYYETLQQLRVKLQQLVEPDHESKYISAEGQQKPRFQSGKELESWGQRLSDAGYIQSKLESGGRFPRYRMQRYPQNLDEVRKTVAEWEKAIEDLLGESLGKANIDLITERLREENGEVYREMAPLRVYATGEIEFGQKEWFQRVESAHEALAWSRYLLGCDLVRGVPRRGGANNRIEQLLKEAREISRACMFRPLQRRSTRARRMAERMKSFLQALVEVKLLLRLEQEAQRFLKEELGIPHQILEVVNREYQTIWKELSEPDYSVFISGRNEDIPQCRDEALAPWLERARDVQENLNHLQQGWQFPRSYRRVVPPDLGTITLRIEEWKQAVSTLIGLDWDQIGVEFFLRDAAAKGEHEHNGMRPLRVSALIEETDEWDERITKAHRVRALAWELLGFDLKTGKPLGDSGLVGKLFSQAHRISWTLYGLPFPIFRSRKAARLADLMPDFVSLLAKVDCLLDVAREAAAALERELQEKGSAIFTADLSDPLEYVRKATWLQLLHAAVRRGDPQSFRHQVLRGAAGLTEVGLRYMLGLGPQTGFGEIYKELASHMGQILDDKGYIHEAPWWAEQPISSTLSYEYRILPPVAPTLREKLVGMAKDQPAAFHFTFTPALSELMIVAFAGASLTREAGDTVTTLRALLSPFLPVVKTALEKWDHQLTRVPVGQQAIVSAGVGGEPLYKEALRAAGLADEDIEKIGYYYRFC